jgi:hypothetical protein
MKMYGLSAQLKHTNCTLIAHRKHTEGLKPLSLLIGIAQPLVNKGLQPQLPLKSPTVLINRLNLLLLIDKISDRTCLFVSFRKSEYL